MSIVYTRSAFKELYQALFNSLVERDWVIAASLAAECHSYVNQAFMNGYREVAKACLAQLEDLVSPVCNSEFKLTHGYDGLWRSREMRGFILRHLEYSSEQAIAISEAITADNADIMVDKLIRHGVLEPTGEDYDDGVNLCGQYSVDLVGVLLDGRHYRAAVSLMTALASAELVETSDFYVDKDFGRALARLDEIGPDFKQVMEKLQDPLVHVTSVRRRCEDEHIQIGIDDIQKIAELGAPVLAKELLLAGSYCSAPIDLCELERAFAVPFTRQEILIIGSHREDDEDYSAIWIGSALKYWLHNQDMAWPFAHGVDEVNNRERCLAKSPTACMSLEEIPDEVANQVSVMLPVFDAHPFASTQEKDQAMEKVVRLYLSGHAEEEVSGCIQGFFQSPLKAIAMRTVSHDKRDQEFSADLGL